MESVEIEPMNRSLPVLSRASVPERAESDRLDQRRPPELASVSAARKEEANGVEAADTREHAQARLLVGADPVQIHTVRDEKSEQADQASVPGDIATMNRSEQSIVALVELDVDVRTGSDQVRSSGRSVGTPIAGHWRLEMTSSS